MFTTGIYFIVRLVLLQLYPAYSCFKAIKLDDQRQFLPLLIYWVTATTFLVAEYFANIAFFWVPFYTEIKLLLVLWITLPQTKGAIVLYADFIEPFLIKHEAEIDKALVEVQDNAKKTMAVYGKELVRVIGRLVTDLLRKGRSLAEEDEAALRPEAATAAPRPPPPSAWESYIYGAFSSIMNRGSQLTAILQTAAQARLETDSVAGASPSGTIGEPAPPPPPPPPSGNSSIPASTTMPEDESAKLERSESYDSLGSFIASRRTVASGSSSKASPPINNNAAPQSESWGSYLSGFMWKTTSGAAKETKSASDSPPKTEKTD